MADPYTDAERQRAYAIGVMEYAGIIEEVSTDPRCYQVVPGAARWHAPDCECRFVPADNQGLR